MRGMKRSYPRRVKPPKPPTPDKARQNSWLAPLVACLAAGAGLGTFYFARWGSGLDLTAYLEKIADSGRLQLFFFLFFGQLLYLVPLFLSGYFHRGLGAVALLFGLKGFFTARLAVAFLHSYGGRGYAALAVAYFLQSFCSIFCMLLLGCHAAGLLASRRVIPRGRRRLLPLTSQPEYDAAGLTCLLLCLLCSLAGCLLSPPLSRAALALIS